MSQVTTESDVTLPPSDSTPTKEPAVVHSYGLTDRGQVRPSNEDNFLIAQLTKSLTIQQCSLAQPKTQLGDVRGHLFLVADGMGGHQAGEHASALAVETIEQFMLNTFKWFFELGSPEEKGVLKEFQSALRAADARVTAEGKEHFELRGMGTTLTMAYTQGADLYVIHAGDSRAYLRRGAAFRQLTQDHTLVGELVRQGHLSAEEAEHHRFRHIITNAVGGPEPGVKVEVHKVGLEVGDRLLLCTDGLTGMVPDPRLAEILEAGTNPRACCEELIREANAHGGKDNITAIVALFDAVA